jgi:hypothetical protein
MSRLLEKMFRRRALLAVLAAIAVLLSPRPTVAEDEKSNGSSVSLVPADAAFYSSTRHMREQVEAVAKSRAWAKLMSLPLLQQGKMLAQMQLAQPQGPAAQIMAIYRQPENQQLVQLLGEMFSDEVFCYGAANVTDFTSLMMEVMGGARYGPAMMQLSGEAKGPPGQAQARAVLGTLSANIDRVKFPDTVVGFKLRKTAPAEAQLKRLETLLNSLAQQVPQLAGRVKRQKVVGCDFLILALDGSMVPWDRVPLKDIEATPGEYEPLIKKLKALKLTISLGVRDNWLLLSFGEGTAGVEKLGDGEALAGRAELKPLEAHGNQRVTSVSYISKAFRAAVGTNRKDIDQIVGLANQLLPMAKLPEGQIERIKKDVANLAKDIKRFVAEPGAAMSFTFWTDRGYEGYSYDWSEPGPIDSSKPLSILHHVGGFPVLAVAGRSTYSPENYQLFEKWVKTLDQYIQDLVVPKLEGEQKEQFEKISKIVRPLLKRLNTTTRTLLLPALADGQGAFVIDGKLRSKQWQKRMPESEKELPILEPAIVIGVSDAAKLRQAFAEYRAIANDLIHELHGIHSEVPDFQIPEPQTKKLETSTSYSYPLPEHLGLDPQLVPNAGLSDHVATLTASESHTERLLKNTPLKVEGGPLADLEKPRAGAAYFSWSELVTTLTPWADFAVHTAVAQRGGDAKMIQDHVHVVLDVLKCFRMYTSSTYLEDKVRVTHRETLVKDF